VLVVELTAGGVTGLGYTYTTPAALAVVRDLLVPVLAKARPLETSRAFWEMAGAVRNAGWPGIAAFAISAADVALHDLKAKLLEVPLVSMLGGAQESVMAYGSGGFTSYTLDELQRQIAGWADEGMRAVKMKIGRHPGDDLARVHAAREAIGPDVELFVDANGAYTRTQALWFAERFAADEVTWFEEPVSSDDLEGLRSVRDRAPGGMRIAAGEYGYTPSYFHSMLAAGAVDTLQADATRCGGVTGFLLASAIAQGAGIPLSAHTAPGIHASIAAAVHNAVNIEYFHDHVRIEELLFDGRPALVDGRLVPDTTRPGHGLSLRADAAAEFESGRWEHAFG
jgi:L-alanine-DL-glutamate epimerase-like enolase superfamily enzyme